jgi:hypothetical protein
MLKDIGLHRSQIASVAAGRRDPRSPKAAVTNPSSNAISNTPSRRK